MFRIVFANKPSMKIFNSTAELRLELDSQRRNGQCIGLVPTMGNLHAGHLRLIEEACLLYTSPSPRDGLLSRMPSSA